MKNKTLFAIASVCLSLGIPMTSQAVMASTTVVQQQTTRVKGKVVDQTGEPIIGASVLLKGSTNGTITDIDGNFSLENVGSNAIITISYVGYVSQEIKVKESNLGTIVLKEDSKVLDELVVIGYGVQKKADLTGSVARVSTDDLNTQSNATIGQALQGKIAGVDIVSQGGTPGGGTRIMVRGIGTLNNSAPLYIVDGMYMTSIDHVNPSDIESIDVLKDASSAAIYGSRAANGVVIVTTKSGTNTESKPQIELSANIGVQVASKTLDMCNAAEWADITTQARAAFNKAPLDMATDLASKEDNDWQDIMLRPAVMQNYNLSIKGGGKYHTYYNSVGYTNQDGIVKGTNYQRFSLQSKNDYKNGIFAAGVNVILTYDENKPVWGGIRGGMIGRILLNPPTLAKYDENNVGGYGASYGDVINLEHPLVLIDDNLMKRTENNTKIYANAYLSLEPIKGLKYKLNVTPDFQFYRYNEYEGVYETGLQANDIATTAETQTRRRNVLVENLISYDATFGKHKVSALAGYSYQDTRYRLLYGFGKGMSTGIQEIDGASEGLTTNGNTTRAVLTSLLGRVFYSFDNRYLVTATIRRDGSSKFGSNYRYGNFPSASLGWNIAEEKFLKNRVNWIDQLKLRAGYGVLGNQEIDDYQYSSVITTGINYPNGEGGVINGAFPKNFANPDIHWEETAMTNIGIDFLALGNRLSLTADWYVKNTKDILLQVPIPISTGAANDPVKNAGKIRNKGFEFNLGWNDAPTKDLRYTVNLIGTFNKNEVVEMGNESQSITGGTIHGGTWTTKTLAGYPIGGFWLIETDGYFNSDAEAQNYKNSTGKVIQPSAVAGDIRFKDINDDGVIDDKDRVYCGSPFPKFTYSLNGTLTYKNLDVALTFQGVAGNKIYNATRLQLTDVTNGGNKLREVVDYWTPQNTNASVPRLTANDTNRNNRSESTRFLESGSYFRLRNLQIGYTIPKEWLHGIVQKARVYVSADNLFTITSYKGYSPDVNASNVYQRGFDEFIYPNTSTYMFGLNVTF